MQTWVGSARVERVRGSAWVPRKVRHHQQPFGNKVTTGVAREGGTPLLSTQPALSAVSATK